MADIITRLLLDSSKYDSGLQRAQRSLDKYIEKNVSVSNVLGKVGSTLTKMAGTVGVAMGAYEAFDKVMRGSQTTSDAYDAAIRAAKTSVDNFFTSISTGDFSAFNAGLDSMIAKAVAANDAIDALGNATMSYGYFNTKNQADFAAQMAVLRDKTASKASKEAAKKQVDEILKDQKEITQQLAKKSMVAVQNLTVEGNLLDASQIKRKDIDDVLRLDISNAGDKQKEELDKRYNEYKEKINSVYQRNKSVITHYSNYGGAQSISYNHNQIKKEQAELNKEYLDAIVYHEMLTKKSDQWLKDMIGIVSASDSAERALAQMVNTYNRAKNGVNDAVVNNNKSEKGKKKDDAVTFDATAEITNVVFSDADNDLLRAMQSRDKGLPTIVQPIEAIVQNRDESAPDEGDETISKLQFKLSTYDLATKKIAEYRNLLAVANDEEKQHLQEQIELYQQIQEQMAGTVDSGMRFGELTSVIGATSHSVYTLGSAIGGTAGATLSAIGNIMQAIAAAIPAITALTAAKETESNANTKAAVSGAASSVASIPIVGPIMAVAAVASVIGAIISASRNFAEGGIVPGHTWNDGITARISSGEMVINEADQKRLYDSIHNGGAHGGGASYISGEQIVTVINNYGRRTGRGEILRG